MSYVLSLSEGSLDVLLNGGCFENPIVQILDHHVAQDDDGYKSLQLLVSDGKHSHNFRMLITPENAKMMEELSKYSIVKIQEFQSLLRNEKFVKVILSMDMVMVGKHICKEIGNPQVWRENLAAHSNSLAAQLSSLNSQPTTSVAQPTTPMAQPSTPLAQPTTHAAQPTTHTAQPSIITAEPTTPKSQSTILSSQPATPVSTTPSSHVSTPSSHIMTPTSHIITPSSHATTPLHTITPSDTTTPHTTTPFDTPNSSRSIISSSKPIATSSKNKISACKKLFPNITRIVDLQSGNNMKGWQIKACVMSKSHKCTSRNNIKWFSMELFDESEEIRAVVFENTCDKFDKFHDMFEINKVYLISEGALICDKNPNDRKNIKWQIKIHSNTIVQESKEFIPIREISTKPEDSYIDVIGVCKSASELQEEVVTNVAPKIKRDTLEEKVITDIKTKVRKVTLVDNSSNEDNSNQIVLTLLGDEAETFDATAHPVIAVMRARVKQSRGIKELIYSQGATVLHMEPRILEAHLLRRWYDDVANMEGDNDSVKLITFSEANALQIGAGNEFSILGVVTKLVSENVVYKSCPENWCNKKLVVLQNDLFKCEKCNKEFSNHKYSICLMAVVSDPTGDQSVTAFNSCAEVMLGKNAEEINNLFEHDRINYIQTFEDLLYKIFVFKICTKMETFENVRRRKYIAVHVQPIDYKETNRSLILSIKSITGKEI